MYKNIAHVVAFITVIVWGSTFVFTKKLLLAGLSPAQIFTLRFVIAYLLLLAFSLCRPFVSPGAHHRWLSHSLADELLMLALGITGGSLYFLSENEALRFTTTTNASLIVCSCPLAASLLIGLFYRSERMSRVQLFGAVTAVLGVCTVIMNGHFVLHLSPIGDTLALCACLCWAVYSLLMVPANKKYDAVFITRKVFFYGLLTMVPYYIANPGFPSVDVLMQPGVLANLLFLGSIASMLCFLLWTWVMKRLGAVIATNYVYLNPISTIVFSFTLLDEPITPWFLFGSCLILLGMYLADKR